MSTTSSSGERAASKLDRADVQWIVAHGARIVDGIPRHGRTWRWSDAPLDSGTLSQLSHRGLIEHADRDEQTWRTPRRTIEALAEYQGVPEDEVGVTVGQERIADGEADDEGNRSSCGAARGRGRGREDGPSQAALAEFE